MLVVTVIKPADKGNALEALRQLGDTAFYVRVDKDLTSTHQTTISNTIYTFIANGDVPDSAKNLISTTHRTPVMYFVPEAQKAIKPH